MIGNKRVINAHLIRTRKRILTRPVPGRRKNRFMPLRHEDTKTRRHQATPGRCTHNSKHFILVVSWCLSGNCSFFAAMLGAVRNPRRMQDSNH